MAALRWILLLAGLVFLIMLAAWEMRRSREGRVPAPPQRGRDGQELGAAALADPSSSPAPSPAALADPSAEARASAPGEPLSPQGAPAAPVLQPAPSSVSVQQREAAATVPLSEPRPTEPAPSLRVEWPPEAERHILTVRVIAPSEERLSGRAVRQALDACGFVHGRYRIYHQPGADGRALVSCASLGKPGSFDPITLDFQRLTGLSLFTVLPGPLPPAAALERLLETARGLAQRLHAGLQDEQGHALDADRLQVLRCSAQELSASSSGAVPPA